MATTTATATDTKYEGWTNRATWCVKLWLDNDYPLYQKSKNMTSTYLNRPAPTLYLRIDGLANGLMGMVTGGLVTLSRYGTGCARIWNTCMINPFSVRLTGARLPKATLKIISIT